MRRRYAVAGLAVVIGTAGWALPSASAGDRGHDDGDDHGDARIIRVMSREVDSADLDLGERGFSLGDRFVFTDNLIRHGMRVGTDHGECTVTRMQGQAGSFQCIATAVFRGMGQITVQGVAMFSEDDSSPFRLAITGGTGRFSDAGGHLVVHERGASDLLVFHLED